MDYRQESMVNIAFEILTKSAGAMSFYDIWKEVAEKKEFDEEQKDDNESLFYTNMMRENFKEITSDFKKMVKRLTKSKKSDADKDSGFDDFNDFE